MKIGIYNPRVAIARAGGTETFLREMIKRLQDKHEITLYCGAGQPLDEVRSLSVDRVRIPFTEKETRLNRTLSSLTPMLPAEVESLTMYANAQRRGILNAINNRVDVLSTHYYLDSLLISRAVSVPTLFRFPGIKQPSVRWKAMQKFSDTDTYVANSEATAHRLRRWLDLNVDGTVYAGVDLDQFTPDGPAMFEDDTASILFVGRIDEGKGLRDLIEAQSRLGDVTRLYLVGQGTIESELRWLVQQYDIENVVQFLGAVPHSEIQEYYTAADIFCLPSYHEGFPVVNMEAMASGCAVVSTQIDSIREQITNGENGLLVEPGDIDGLTTALRRVATDTDLRTRLAEAGLRTAPKFSWASQAAEMEAMYERTAQR